MTINYLQLLEKLEIWLQKLKKNNLKLLKVQNNIGIKKQIFSLEVDYMPLQSLDKTLKSGLAKKRVFFKKTQPGGFFGFFWGFIGFYWVLSFFLGFFKF